MSEFASTIPHSRDHWVCGHSLCADPQRPRHGPVALALALSYTQIADPNLVGAPAAAEIERQGPRTPALSAPSLLARTVHAASRRRLEELAQPCSSVTHAGRRPSPEKTPARAWPPRRRARSEHAPPWRAAAPHPRRPCASGSPGKRPTENTRLRRRRRPPHRASSPPPPSGSAPTSSSSSSPSASPRASSTSLTLLRSTPGSRSASSAAPPPAPPRPTSCSRPTGSRPRASPRGSPRTRCGLPRRAFFGTAGRGRRLPEELPEQSAELPLWPVFPPTHRRCTSAS